jgi:hypothetical protein
MFCPYCGAENEEGATFCVNCEADLISVGFPPAPRKPRRWKATVLLLILFLFFSCVLCSGGYIVYLRPRLEAYILERVRDSLAGRIELWIPSHPHPFEIRERDVNEYLEEAMPYHPIEQLRVYFRQDIIGVSVTVFRITSQIEGRLSAKDGEFLLYGGRISGPLRFILSPQKLANVLNEEVNAALRETNIVINAIQLSEGKMVICASEK